MLPQLYTEQEVADCFKVSPATVARERRKGLLKASKVGNAYRYSEDRIREYLALMEKPQYVDGPPRVPFKQNKSGVRWRE